MRHIRTLPMLLVVSAALSACAVGPRHVVPATPPLQLASSEAKQFAAASVPAAWWTFLDDARLGQLIDAAMRHNHDVRASQASLRAARAVFEERQLGSLPAVTAGTAYERSSGQQAGAGGATQRGVSTSYRAGFDMQWEIDLFGRLEHLSTAADARAGAVQADLDWLRLSLAAEVGRAYYEQQGLGRRLDIARAQADSWRETLALVRARVRLGSGLPEDAENAQANLLRSEATVPPLRAAWQAAAYRLDVLTGERPGSAREAARAVSPAPLARQLPLGDVAQWLRQRPDVLRAERLLAASTADVGAATADLYPRLNLGGFVGFFALRGADLGSAARALTVAPGVAWPAFPASGRARLRASAAQADGALARYEQSLLLAQEEVENAVTRLAHHQDRQAALLQSAGHGAAALDIAQRRYQAGAGSYLAVLDNQRALFQIRQELAEAETASYLNIIALYKALGWGSGPV